MNPGQLIAHFDRISDASDAIPRLRQFILELAVRGKLVDRDSRDEPVAELLQRIQTAKAKRIEEERGKKQEPLLQVRSSEAWFDIPPSWCWVRLGTITQIIMGQSPPGETYNKTGEGIPLINGPVEFTQGPFGRTVINQYTTAPTNLCEEGDLLLCVRGSTTGRTNIAGFRACIGRGVAAIRPFFADQYVRLFIWRLRTSIIAMGRGIAFPSVNRQQIEELPVPLPPLDEQHRIVAKVDELMALCDRLEASQAERESRRDSLVASSLNRLNNGADPDAFHDHARFYFNHLPRLTTKPEHIQQLRQTILSLAVRGKLVPQNPNDETAELLLRRVASTAKVRLQAKGEQDDIGPRFVIPSSWAWVRLPRVLTKLTDGTHHSPPNGSQGDFKYVTAKNIKDNGILLDGITFVSKTVHKEIYSRCDPSFGDVLYIKDGATTGVATINQLTEPFSMLSSVALLKPSDAILNRYLLWVMRSPFFYGETRGAMKGIAITRVTLSVMAASVLPLPPLAEQHRIVTRIDELMGLCDKLDAQLATTHSDSRRLLEAVLHEALAPAV